MQRSLVTVDVGAIRDNARTLAGVLGRAELWAVVKADGYGHGAADAARAALEGGATTLCVATVGGREEKLTARVPTQRAPSQGERIHLRPAGDDVHFFDPESGVRLS